MYGGRHSETQPLKHKYKYEANWHEMALAYISWSCHDMPDTQKYYELQAQIKFSFMMMLFNGDAFCVQ